METTNHVDQNEIQDLKNNQTCRCCFIWAWPWFFIQAWPCFFFWYFIKARPHCQSRAESHAMLIAWNKLNPSRASIIVHTRLQCVRKFCKEQQKLYATSLVSPQFAWVLWSCLPQTNCLNLYPEILHTHSVAYWSAFCEFPLGTAVRKKASNLRWKGRDLSKAIGWMLWVIAASRSQPWIKNGEQSQRLIISDLVNKWV